MFNFPNQMFSWHVPTLDKLVEIFLYVKNFYFACSPRISGLRIHIDLMRIGMQYFFLLRIRIQGFVDQKIKQILHLKKMFIFGSIMAITYQ
jgi:hypothetical protein